MEDGVGVSEDLDCWPAPGEHAASLARSLARGRLKADGLEKGSSVGWFAPPTDSAAMRAYVPVLRLHGVFPLAHAGAGKRGDEEPCLDRVG